MYPGIRARALALAASTLLFSGCSIPGITHTREVFYAPKIGKPILGPDGARYAYSLYLEELRFPVGVARWPNGGVPMYGSRRIEVFVGNRMVRNAPTLVFVANTSPLIGSECAWESGGIFLRTWDGEGNHYVRIDPGSWASAPVGQDSGNAVFKRREAMQTHSVVEWQHIGHVEERVGQFFYWHPESYTKELLFEMPSTIEGHRLPPTEYWSSQRVEDAYDDAIHRLRFVRGVLTRQSITAIAQTFVPRPGSAARAYSIDYSLTEFDAAPDDELERARRGIVRRMVVLGPRDTVIQTDIPLKALQGVGKTYSPLFVRLKKIAEPGDSISPNGLVQYGSSDGGAAFREGEWPQPPRHR